MRVVVTGAAGFIGSHLCAALHASGHEAVAIDDLSFGKASNLSSEIFLHAVDAASPEALFPLVDGADALVHLAAAASVPFGTAHPIEAHRSNAISTLVALEGARRAGVGRVVVASSAAVYGNLEALAREDRPWRPESFYAQDKVYGEMALKNYCALFGLHGIAVRPFNVYGPRQSADGPYGAVIPQWVRALAEGRPLMVFGDGRQSRDFTYVSDIVNGLVKVLEADPGKLDGRAVNLARGEETSLLDLIDVLREVMGSKMRIEVTFGPERTGDIRHSRADITLARDLFGYEPKVDLLEGIRETVEWFRWEAAS